jgi:hypothetical protein
MGNKFITPTHVARDASIVLNDLLVVGHILHRDKEAKFKGSKIGDSMKVTVPPVLGDADEFSGSTSATNIVETEIDLTLEKHFYKRVDLTTKQKSLELHDFTRLVTVPVMRSFSQSIEKYLTNQLQVFRHVLSGTVTNRPSTAAHIAAANKALNDAFISKSGRVALIDTTVESSLLQLAQFESRDKGDDGPSGLRNATLGTRYGFTYHPDALLGAFSRGDVGGTVLVSATTAAGSETLVIKDLSEAAGTIRAGTVFVIAGDTTRYVVRKDAKAASNVATLTIYPALKAQAAGDAGITFEAAGYMNLAFHPAAVTAAIVAPDPLNVNSVVQSINGISVRVSMDSSITTLADSVVFDLFVGARVIQPNGGCLFCG